MEQWCGNLKQELENAFINLDDECAISASQKSDYL
jgi:hypothetical protein